MENTLLSVSDFIALTNQTLEFAYPLVTIEGEVSSFKINQGKFVFFDLKDDQGSVGCFMMVYQLRLPIEDGMKVIITASPKLTQWGKFSLTIRTIRPSGEGSLKKSFDLLKEKLDKEGLFALERKRTLPALPQHIGIITSTEAAGYADFVKILNDRWGGLRIDVAHVQVQGATAPDQMIRALRYLNELEEIPEVILLLRGGGSADDLAAFNDELLVRAIAASRVPTMVAVGHEVDVSLADLVADVRAATPSNAAQLLVPDRAEVTRSVQLQVGGMRAQISRAIEQFSEQTRSDLQAAYDRMRQRLDDSFERLATLRLAVAQLNPESVLRHGYAILRGEAVVGGVVEIETQQAILTAEVTHVSTK
jgi:exodeoxyribonuclease VII large subunit